MRIIIFSMCLMVSSLAYCQKPSDPIILRTADDVSSIQTANDWILVTTTQTGADHDADAYIKEYQEIMQAVDKRLEEIANTKLDGLHECYITDSVEEIISNKTISGNHNPALKLLGLSNAGDEKEKVYRIIEELERRGLR